MTTLFTRATTPGGSGWREIGTAPKDGTEILLAYERDEYLPEPWPLVIIAHWFREATGKGFWVWQNHSARGYGSSPVAWQPLPTPPIATGSGA